VNQSAKAKAVYTSRPNKSEKFSALHACDDVAKPKRRPTFADILMERFFAFVITGVFFGINGWVKF
jgi:hypothetical protein